MRLINADRLMDAVDEIDWYHLNKRGEMVSGANDDYEQPWFKSDDIYKAIKDAPTVDAVPVVHGRWLPENRTMDYFWVCSVCKFPSEAHGAFKLYKYCPNCGARMDGEQDG